MYLLTPLTNVKNKNSMFSKCRDTSVSPVNKSNYRISSLLEELQNNNGMEITMTKSFI